MPQMAPMNWLMLFIYFLCIFLMVNTLNYFNFTYLVKKTSLNKKKISYSWKW
uniref:ATP synthase complex subunit 8 n=1 Tax=Coleoptera sp. 28 KM-2017 TaxID=2219332 RepID=A0A346RKB9_9COLE|nr:ATP synthase F0 subunit 8 [Coleoptera sp. 28 KM-2017]